MESWLTAPAGAWGLGGGGIEPKGKRPHEHGQQCGDCWGGVGWGGSDGGRGCKGDKR